jgi:hypothetical protein
VSHAKWLQNHHERAPTQTGGVIFLAPAITAAILNGGHRATLMLGDLNKGITLSWNQQQSQLEIGDVRAVHSNHCAQQTTLKYVSD